MRYRIHWGAPAGLLEDLPSLEHSRRAVLLGYPDAVFGDWTPLPLAEGRYLPVWEAEKTSGEPARLVAWLLATPDEPGPLEKAR